jgi:hypothetical protein
MNLSRIKTFPGILLIDLFLARKIPGNPEMPKVFPARRSLISVIPRLPAGDGDHSLTFLTVYFVRIRNCP